MDRNPELLDLTLSPLFFYAQYCTDSHRMHNVLQAGREGKGLQVERSAFAKASSPEKAEPF